MEHLTEFTFYDIHEINVILFPHRHSYGLERRADPFDYEGSEILWQMVTDGEGLTNGSLCIFTRERLMDEWDWAEFEAPEILPYLNYITEYFDDEFLAQDTWWEIPVHVWW
jgi:hypothetical protein